MIGQNKNKELLMQWRMNKSVPRFIIITGKKGSGRLTFAKLIIKTLGAQGIIVGKGIGVPLSIFAINHRADNKVPAYIIEQEQVQPTQVYEVSEPEPYIPDDVYEEGMFNETYTEEEVLLLAACVYAEAGSESVEVQRGVASVILNRVKSDKYPNSIKEVIYQNKPLQYECTINGTLGKYEEIYNGGNYNESDLQSLESAFENTLYILETGSELPENVLYQAEFKQGKGVYKKVGRTYFCYEEVN